MACCGNVAAKERIIMSLKQKLIGWVVPLVVPSIKKNLTVDLISDKATDGIDYLATRAAEKLCGERLGRITRGCSLGANSLIAVSHALDPEGDGGSVITPNERTQILANTKEAVLALITPEALERIIDEAVAKAVGKIA